MTVALYSRGLTMTHTSWIIINVYQSKFIIEHKKRLLLCQAQFKYGLAYKEDSMPVILPANLQTRQVDKLMLAS